MDAPLAEALAVDSGSEDEEELTVEQLNELLRDDDPNDNTRENEDDDLSGQDVDFEFTWSEDYNAFTATREDFQEEVGSRIAGTSPCDLFCQLWDQPLLESIVEETNRYAWQTIAKASESEIGISAKSRVNDWVETSVSEIYRLIAVIILMGMCLRGRMEEYWATSIIEMPKFRKMMSLNRFMLLMKFLHFRDNDTITDHGKDRKIAKILPILEYCIMKFKAAYSPRRELAIDESLLFWNGHLSSVQCIRSKAARFGIKSFELCESVSGYVLDIILYTGKGSTAAGAVEAIYGFTSSTAKIVLKLMGHYLGKGYFSFHGQFLQFRTIVQTTKV